MITNLKHKGLTIILLTTFSTIQNSGVANEVRNTGGQHGIEIELSAGDLSHNLDELGFNEATSKHLNLGYLFQFRTGAYIGLGHLRGESGKISVTDDLFGGNELEYSAFYIKAGYEYFAFSNQSLYAELSLNRHDMNLAIAGTPQLETSRTGHSFSTGWRYYFDNNASIKIGLENLKFGNSISTKSVAIGVGFHF